jgi:hypothetical protein
MESLLEKSNITENLFKLLIVLLILLLTTMIWAYHSHNPISTTEVLNYQWVSDTSWIKW